MSTPRGVRRLAAAIAGLLLAAGSGLGQEPRDPVEGERRIRASAQLRWTAYDNFFQAPAGQQDSVVQATSVRVQLVADAVRRVGAELYLEGGFTTYDSFEPTFGLAGGLRGGRRTLRIDVGGGYDRRLPRLDLGDTFARADVARGHAEARLRLGPALELTGLGRATWQAILSAAGPSAGESPDPREEWGDFTFVELEAKARTRALGRLFSPEVGIGRGRPWNGGSSSVRYDQSHWQLQIRSAPSPQVYLSLRYRVRRREYPYAAVGSRSFGREDRREQIAVTLDLQVASRLTWNVYYTEEDAHSSLASRSFRTRAITLGMTLQER